MAEKKNQTKHFVLVHGLCHGAWCWYKLKPQLESAGHKVTVLDLAASGINMKIFGHDVPTFHEYTRPLLGFLASLNEPAILVGHSFGGMSLALAMDLFPHKISVAVFLTAFMPDTIHPPSYVLDKHLAEAKEEYWQDSQTVNIGNSEESVTLTTFGPKFLASNLYQLSPVEDLELAKTLVRPGSLFHQELSKAKNFSDEGYGSVTRVYVVCDEDKAIKLEVQRWMIRNNPPKDVLEIKGADHMAMLSKTKQVCDSLLEIANKYAN
ncbi:hypothetical protein CCACVL1_26296 [Corchorus capsularis]|uniref:AB hydrolase-1 domain-containing protein n=1 Tax=Corchorus capsularis TaxID=210143 RepID=A0A1R3GFE7_COCAP|nr:hypothetical protein CCACVL1_26296 [Corchorus capsularis]